MAAERIIGVDFGTSTSVIRVMRYIDGMGTEPKSVKFQVNKDVVPTLIRKINDVVYFGYDAQAPKKNSELFQNFKVDLESDDIGKKTLAKSLTKEFFAYMAKIYREQSMDGHFGEASDKEKTLVSYPVKWSDEIKEFMVSVAKEAGFPNVEGMDEAQAAIHAVTTQSGDMLKSKGYFKEGQTVKIMLIDMGAGTTDIVLCEYTPCGRPYTKILSTWPKKGDILFGGSEVDELLMDYVKSTVSEEGTEAVFKRCGSEKFKAWKEEVISPALMRGETVSEFSDFDSMMEVLEIETNYEVGRNTFETYGAEYLKKLPQLINGCLLEAGIGGNSIDLVILTGGHSQWYFVKDIIADKLPQIGVCNLSKIKEDNDRIVQISLPHETVALGLVYNNWKGAYAPRSEPKEVVPEKKEVVEPEKTYHEEPVRTVEYHTPFSQPVYEDNSVSSYGELVTEFIESVQVPPAKNGARNFSGVFLRQLKEYHNLPNREDITYLCRAILDMELTSGIKNRFFFTNSYLVVPIHGTIASIPAGHKKILWKDFVNVKIDGVVTAFGSAYVTFNNDKVDAVYPLSYTKTVADKWRYFYLDLQKYLRDNAYRIKR
ncbi:MAG: Hsp70 family protein [Clostridia bacterium]|nr:Hsp70 family protein [Clostridia bacterium]